jgi:hypothetical protein
LFRSAIDNAQYEADVKAQMKSDIDAVIPYIKNQINVCGERSSCGEERNAGRMLWCRV